MNATSERPAKAKPEPKILHQTFFKSVGPRTYASQVKELANGNQMLLLTEGRRDESTGELRKTRLAVFAEDFAVFFNMLKETSQFIDAHPLPEAVRQRRQQFWKKAAARKTPVAACA
ncbi:MAG TPA: DUF3276 family protein [Tepidisphaeraceae bacterium]|nr:DUF3276 family protein [Tepidisphaeraceae bacterium]